MAGIDIEKFLKTFDLVGFLLIGCSKPKPGRLLIWLRFEGFFKNEPGFFFVTGFKNCYPLFD